MTIEKTPWRLDRSVSLGDLLVFLSLLAAGISYVMHQDARATRSEVKIDALEATDARHDKAIADVKDNLEKRLDRVETKIDRVLERMGGKP